MTKQATIQSSQSGQILVLIILVSLVALSAGLSLASRTITNIKSSGNLDQSNRAFSAAEAGVEHALGQLKLNSCVPSGSPISCSTSVGSTPVSVNVSNVGGTVGQAYGSSAVNQDDVIQLSLAGYTGKSFNLYWSTQAHGGAQGTSPAVEVSILYCNANPCTSSSTYGLAKVAADWYAGARGDGFNYYITSNNPVDTLSVPSGSGLPTGSYGFKTTINLSDNTLNLSNYPMLVPAGNYPVLARVRLMFYGPDPVAMTPPPLSSYVFPTQGKLITSTANVNGKQRTVTVFQSSPQLPAIFDYAIFNGSNTALTK